METLRTNSIHLEWLIRSRLPDVLDIEEACFEYAWTEDEFLRELRKRNVIGQIALNGREVVGFIIYELLEDAIHLLSLAVKPSNRRQGVASRMVSDLIGKLYPDSRWRLVAMVRETNLPAHLFFRNQGFTAVHIAHGYYTDSGEDAYAMQYEV